MGRHTIVGLAICVAAAWICVAPLNTRLSAQAAATPPADQKAQIEKGRQVAAQVCTTCHTTFGRMVQVHTQTAEQWRDTVYFMISRGAQLMPDEIEPVVAFLTASAGGGAQSGAPAGGAAPGRGGRGGGGGAQTAATGGAAILQRNCQQCHELAVASKKPASGDRREVISRMVTYGAQLTPAEQQTLVEYLNGLEK